MKPIYAVVNPIVPQGDTWLDNPETFISNFISTLFTLFLIITVIYFVVNIFQAGHKYILSKGDKNKAQEVNEHLTYAFIGVFVIFAVFALLKLIGSIFGIEGLENLQLTWPSLGGSTPQIDYGPRV